jgi:hypothetical protein
MKPKTEEFLYLMLWSADQLARPTFRNLTYSFETWAYRNGLFRELARLEKRQLLERDVQRLLSVSSCYKFCGNVETDQN